MERIRQSWVVVEGLNCLNCPSLIAGSDLIVTHKSHNVIAGQLTKYLRSIVFFKRVIKRFTRFTMITPCQNVFSELFNSQIIIKCDKMYYFIYSPSEKAERPSWQTSQTLKEWLVSNNSVCYVLTSASTSIWIPYVESWADMLKVWINVTLDHDLTVWKRIVFILTFIHNLVENVVSIANLSFALTSVTTLIQLFISPVFDHVFIKFE